MEQWLQERLSVCLSFDVPEEMISYILSIKTPHEIDEYFGTLLNFEQDDHVVFLNDFKQRMFKKNIPKLVNSGSQKQIFGGARRKDDKERSPKPNRTTDTSEETRTGAKKKTKFINLYGQYGQETVVLLKGRHHCDCQATKHKLVNNCLKCGRIVCEQEGSGSCLFCGNLVCSEEEQRIIESQSKKGDNLRETLMRQKRPKGWEEALAQRNRLLEYDRNAEKRTTVIDDESDYFKENSVWLSDVERKKLERIQSEMRDQKHESRLNRKVTLDFAGRRVVEDNTMVEIDDEILKKIADVCASKVQSEKLVHDTPDMEFSENVHPGIEGPAPIFDDSVVDKTMKKLALSTGYDGTYSKVQDKEFLEMADQRNCLSMHQPWASLLVEGIKQHEGRTWYTPVRGRLWIAATQKPADPQLVGQLENFYRRHYNNDKLDFPTQYPSGCLLGCVSVQDCLPQEEYRKKFPNGESESPFVLICEEPQALPIRFPNKGQHKIYKLDPTIHQAALKSLLRAARLKAEE